jgi:hypothetical protein
MSPNSVWDAPPLSSDDQKLIEAYRETGRMVDDLPYTADFDLLMERLGGESKSPDKRAVYQRLLYLRKSGRLPRIYQ